MTPAPRDKRRSTHLTRYVMTGDHNFPENGRFSQPERSG
jgi:hypothetical protein